MKNSAIKVKKSKGVTIAEPKEIVMIISVEDIRRRAYEIYLESDGSSSNEQDNWLYAERELTGFYK